MSVGSLGELAGLGAARGRLADPAGFQFGASFTGVLGSAGLTGGLGATGLFGD